MREKEMREAVFEKMSVSLSDYLFRQREEGFRHASYSEEMASVQPVKEGDLKAVERIIKKHKHRTYSVLSESPLQSRKFLFVADVTMVCRFCIEGGMPPEESYGLSDLYLKKTDRCNTPDDVEELYGTMMMDYAQRMKTYREQRRVLSPKIVRCVEYIENHLHDRITVEDLAEEAEMNASYLSTLFAKETGLPVSGYIRRKKLQAAKHLLAYNEYSCTDIAEYLGFAGESHFSALFKKAEGMTPRQYRKMHYEQHFANL